MLIVAILFWLMPIRHVASDVENLPRPELLVNAVFHVTTPGYGFQRGRNVDEFSERQQLLVDQTTPAANGHFRQEGGQAETPEQTIAREERDVRNLERALAGLEIGQGAIEITLGAIRIAASGTILDVLRREDAIAVLQESVNGGAGGEGGGGNTIDVGELPIRRDQPVECSAKSICGQSSRHANPYMDWNDGFRSRMKRFTYLDDPEAELHPIQSPSVANHSRGTTTNSPTLDDAEQLLDLLENLLSTNNKVLRLLDIDLPPITTSSPGEILLQQYRQQLAKNRRFESQYERVRADPEQMLRDRLESNRRGLPGGHRSNDIRAFSSELIELNRLRRRLVKSQNSN